MKVAILGPFHNVALKPFIPNLPIDDPNFPPGTGGYNLTNLVIERINRGLFTDIITLDKIAEKPIQVWEGNYVRLWVIQERKRKRLRDGYKTEIQLIHKVLNVIQPDVCHANWTYEYGFAAVKQKKFPTVLTVHDNTFRILKYYGITYLPLFLITNYVIIKSKYITAVSPYISNYLKRVYKKKIFDIPNVLPEFIWGIKNHNSINGTIKIFSSLNLTKLKNTRNALLAFQVAREYFVDKNLTLVYNISGIKFDEIPHSWKKDNKLFENIHFLGQLPYKENISQMSQSDILFHPSLEEALPGPITEGMALNKPIIASIEAGGSRWLLDDGKCGILAKGRLISSISADLIALINTVYSGKYNTNIAYERIKNICDSNSIIEQYEQIYELAIKNW